MREVLFLNKLEVSSDSKYDRKPVAVLASPLPLSQKGPFV
jgi:hypothetical protein